MNAKFLVGSLAFFKGTEGYKPTNRNFLKLVDNHGALSVESKLSIHHNITYRLLREPAQEMVRKALESGNALLLGNFLVPEVARAIGLTIDNLKDLAPLADKLEGKHRYQATIFNAYLENGSFTLSAEQRTAAYAVYLEHRTNLENETKTTAENTEAKEEE